MSPQDALVNLLLALFEGPELVRFVGYHFSNVRGLERKGWQSTEALTQALLDAGVVDATFFELLRVERPDRGTEIDQVAQAFGVASEAAKTDPAPPAEPAPSNEPVPMPATANSADTGAEPEIPDARREFRARMSAALGQKAAPKTTVHAGWAEAAAVLDNFDPFTLRPFGGDADPSHALEALTPISVENPNGRWVLRQSVRQQTLATLYREGRVLDAIAANADQAGPRTKWVQRMLAGEDMHATLGTLPWNDLAELDQALDWFHGTTAFGVDRRLLDAHLERARTMSPLHKLTGTTFRGRKAELANLRAFIDGTPAWVLVLHGPGGVGKSSLLGRFLLDLQGSQPPIPWVYLDFDDPNHDPRQPRRLLQAIARQLALLYTIDPAHAKAFRSVESAAAADGLSFARLLRDTVEELAGELAEGLKAVAPNTPFVVVLDTFESVQIMGERAVERVRKVIDALHHAWPPTHVIVSGRGPVSEWDVTNVALQELDAESADAVLQARGIHAPERRALIISRFGTNPLTLKLAATAFEKVDADGVIPDIAQDLLAAQHVELQGQLYTRILGHIRDPEIRRLAHPGLVVRVVTKEVIEDVLAEPCGLRKGRAGAIMEKLQRYMGMFEQVDNDTLRHRADIRSVMLRLIQRDPERSAQVDAIHQAAIAYYRVRTRPSDRAELLYHLLATDAERVALQEVWAQDLAPLITPAWDDPLPARARAWLGARLGLLRGDEAWELADWEVHAEREATTSLDTGAPENALRVLMQRTERVPGSPLFRLEAQARLQLGEVDAAWDAVNRGVLSLLEGGANAELLKLRIVAIEVAAARKDWTAVDAEVDQASKLADALDDRAANLRVEEVRQNARRDLGLEADDGSRMVRSFLAADDKTLRRNPELTARVARGAGRKSASVLKKAAVALGNRTDANIFRPDAFVLQALLERARKNPEARVPMDQLAAELGLNAGSYDASNLASVAIRYGRMGDALRIALDASGDDAEILEKVANLIEPRRATARS